MKSSEMVQTSRIPDHFVVRPLDPSEPDRGTCPQFIPPAGATASRPCTLQHPRPDKCQSVLLTRVWPRPSFTSLNCCWVWFPRILESSFCTESRE